MRSKLLFLMLVFAAGALCLPAAVRADSLVFNPSFEIDEDDTEVVWGAGNVVNAGAGAPDEWMLWGSDWSWGGDCTHVFVTGDAEGAHTGNNYLRASCPTGGQNYGCAIPWDSVAGTRAMVPFTEGDVYFVGVWAKDNMPGGQPSDRPPCIEMGYYDAGGVRDDTYRHWIHADIPADGKWHYIEGTTNKGIPAGYPFLNAVPGTWTASENPNEPFYGYPGAPFGPTDYSFDDMWVNTNPRTGLVYDFDPSDNEESVSPSKTILSWKRRAKCPDREIKVEVWWGKQDDPNFWYVPGEAIKIMELADVNYVDLSTIPAPLGGPITLESDSVYYWKVKSEEPNACNWGAPLNESGTLSFDTINRAPVVDTGLNVDKWMASGDGPVTIGIDASYDDDGLPEGGKVTHKWSQVTGVTYLQSNDGGLTSDVQDPNVLISSPGDYTLQLTVNDGYLHPEGKTGDDTMVIRIFSNSDDRFSAHWKLDEVAGQPQDSEGGHHGTKVGTPIQGVIGQVDLAIELDGDDDHIGLPYPDSGSDPNFQADTWDNQIVDSITVSCWMKLDDDGWDDSWESMVTKSSQSWELQRAGSGDGVQFNFRGNDGTVPWSQGGTAAVSGSNLPVNDGQWHQVVGVFDRNQVIVYVDGLEGGATDTDYKKIAKAPGGVTIGTTTQVGSDGDTTPWNEDRSTWDTDSFTFGGTLDQVRIFDAAVPWWAEHSNTPGIVEMYRADNGHDNCRGEYMPGDENQDCLITLADFALVAKNWLECNNIADVNCD